MTKEEYFQELTVGKTQTEIAREAGYENYSSAPGCWRDWTKEYKQQNPNWKPKNVNTTSQVAAILGDPKAEHDQQVYFSASTFNDDGTVSVLPIEEYCEKYGLDHNTVHSYKLIKHSGGAYYNIKFVEKQNSKPTEDLQKAIENTKKAVEDWVKNSGLRGSTTVSGKNTGMVVISDLHIGAFVTSLQKTQKFDKSVIMDYLKDAADRINQFGFESVDVACLGDLVESVSGINHPNTWKSLHHNGYGAKVIQLATEILHECFFSKIQNLGNIKFIGGNHDRLSANKSEDNDGGASELTSWALSLMGYKTEFHGTCIRHEVDDICYVLLHGDKGISKRPTKEIIWDYGMQGKFNVVLEGHLHMRQEYTVSGKNSTLKHLTHSDSIDCRRYICPSFFTGNSYSEDNNWFSTPGFKIFQSNGKGKPNVFDFTL